MRTGMFEFWRKGRWFILWSAVCACLSGYSLFTWITTPKFPQCRANVHLVYDIESRRIEQELMFRIVASGWRETTVSVDGRISEGQEQFNISRRLVFHYSYANDLFHIRLKEVVKGATENVARGDLANLIPPHWDGDPYLRVEKMGVSQYLVSKDQTVLLVCTAL